MFLFLVIFVTTIQAKTYDVLSPDKNIKVRVSVDRNITYAVFFQDKEIVAPYGIDILFAHQSKGGVHFLLDHVQRGGYARLPHGSQAIDVAARIEIMTPMEKALNSFSLP